MVCANRSRCATVGDDASMRLPVDQGQRLESQPAQKGMMGCKCLYITSDEFWVATVSLSHFNTTISNPTQILASVAGQPLRSLSRLASDEYRTGALL